MTIRIRSMYLLGRLRSGSDRVGNIHHAVPEGKFAALCGSKPGRRSVGWSLTENYDAASKTYIVDQTVTCPRCLAKMKRLESSGQLIEFYERKQTSFALTELPEKKENPPTDREDIPYTAIERGLIEAKSKENS